MKFPKNIQKNKILSLENLVCIFKNSKLNKDKVEIFKLSKNKNKKNIMIMQINL